MSEQATPAEIKAAYRDLVKVWHPDRFGGDARLRQRAEERLQRINEAYRRLESGEFAPEAVAPVVPPHPSEARMKHTQIRARTRKERDAALRGWVYLAIVAMVGAFVGYAAVKHARAARESNEVAAPVPQSTASAGTARDLQVAKPERAGAAQNALNADAMRVTQLSEMQMETLEAACGGFAPDSQLHMDCVREQVGAMTGPATHGGGIDLSGLTAGERTSIQHVCARAGSYSQCVAEQLASLAAEPERPDLTQLSARDRIAVERACSSARDHDGPAAYDRCAAEFAKALLPTHAR